MADNFKWMPVFKVGQWKPKSGKLFDATIDVVNEIVAATKALKDTVVPFVLNHPKNESVSFGGFKGKDVRVNNGVIEVLPSSVNSALAEMFNAGKFKGVSVKIGANKALQHLGFLTDNPPAVEGLPEYAFEGEDGSESFEFSDEEFGDYRVSAIGDIFQKMRDKMIESDGIDAAEAMFPQSILDTLKQIVDDPPQWIVDWLNRIQTQIDNGSLSSIFSKKEEEVSTVTNEELKKQLDEANAKLVLQDAKIAAIQQESASNRKTARMLEFSQFCSSDEMKGRITPAIKPDVMEFMSLIDSDEKLEFSGGQKTAVEKFQELLKKLPVQVALGGSVMGEEFAGPDDKESDGARVAKLYNQSRGAK